MHPKELEALAWDAAKTIKAEADLDDFRKILTKITIKTTLNFESVTLARHSESDLNRTSVLNSLSR